MNKKGFTLIELLAVVAVIAIISLIAIPNIVGLSDGIKKDQMIDDAKRMISMAKYQVSKNYSIRNSGNYTFTLSDLNTNGDFNQDPEGVAYQSGGVVYTLETVDDGKLARYCVYLVSTKWKIGTNSSDCVYEDNLYSRSNVVDR